MTGLLHALVEDAAREAGCEPKQVLGRIVPLKDPATGRFSKPNPKAEIRRLALLRAAEEGFSREQTARVFKVSKRAVVRAISKARQR